ncbi:pimeloyl-ACP methyl ester carboxylesterase [Curtobacterium sp. PhB130]|uniref:alpha/beta fold hydrolase n=1 Tax=unclassified Curtobacterium TaxID=257496 RepID=UPI000FBAA38C|nr:MULTISPECIES: alpha/beta fold hydrolase [unclassified Curtobacterium]ROP66395.1 pimeloyl-ACP methyl ester carboxylesterase [Curtobacterium sp. ZW137]ROS73149.1 pimeloyl-ACP methyl ester carboxylesterase [Curtobacterium sp. PhB130]
MLDADDEFRDLADLARASGVTAPLRASRQEIRTQQGGDISAIRWQDPAEPGLEARVTYLHGLGIDAHSFDATALAVGQPAVALDLPGHGRSAWRDDADYAAAATAPAVLAALDALEVPPGVLVGHSLGAILAARIAATAPERVTGLVLVDMSPDFAQRAVDRIARALETEEPFASLDEVVDRAIEARVGDDRAVLLREARHTTRLGEDGKLVRRHHFPHLPAGRTSSVGRFADAWPDLEALDVPILLVRGDRGYVSPKLVTTFAERLPHAEIVTVEARHAVQTQAPLALATAIREWAARNGLLHGIEQTPARR